MLLPGRCEEPAVDRRTAGTAAALLLPGRCEELAADRRTAEAAGEREAAGSPPATLVDVADAAAGSVTDRDFGPAADAFPAPKADAFPGPVADADLRLRAFPSIFAFLRIFSSFLPSIRPWMDHEWMKRRG